MLEDFLMVFKIKKLNIVIFTCTVTLRHNSSNNLLSLFYCALIATIVQQCFSNLVKFVRGKT